MLKIYNKIFSILSCILLFGFNWKNFGVYMDSYSKRKPIAK